VVRACDAGAVEKAPPKKKQVHIDILQCLQHSVNMEMILEDHPDEVRLPGDLCF